MTNEIAAKPIETLSELVANADRNVYYTLKHSIYPGASEESIGMVIAYCNAKNYDPLRKPVHIVAMEVNTGKKDDKGYPIKQKRDVLMPGIVTYRTDADRTGVYVGISEPEYGPMITETFKDGDFTFPEWCKVTVKKLVAGHIVEFSAKEYWMENYATGYNTTSPNTMWRKRKRGQIAKCAEAQALRKAFPDAVGALPTFEEMEGKMLDADEFVEASNKVVNKGLKGVKEAIGITHQDVKESIQVIEQALGHVEPEDSDAVISNNAPIFEDVKKQMQDAKTVECLILAKDVGKFLFLNTEQEDELKAIFKEKQGTLKK